MFSFWSSTLQNIYIHVHTSERNPNKPSFKAQLSECILLFCFQIIILVLSLERVLQSLWDCDAPAAALCRGDALSSLTQMERCSPDANENKLLLF